MIIHDVITEAVDKDSRLVLKRIKTSEGDFSNRKLAITNFMYNCERDRMKYGQPLFNGIFQTCHIRFDRILNDWDYLGLENSKKHAQKNNRIFLPYKQRNEEQLSQMKWENSVSDFNTMVGKVDNVPFVLPLYATLNDWKKYRANAISILNQNQTLIPIISSKHNVSHFPTIIKYEKGKDNLIGINSYELSDITERTNLSYLRAINSDTKTGDKTSLFVNFNYPRILTRLSNIAGSFAFTCFAGDIFSERASFPQGMKRESVNLMFDRKPEEYSFYDSKEKKFNKSLPQKEWYGVDLTKSSMANVSVLHGLSGYQVIKCLSHIKQQDDLDLINALILNQQDVLKFMKNYTGWSVFLDRMVIPSSQTQQTLLKF
ncbi:MAG: hypothetical protein ABSG05_00720 [Candidatus Pacearchaeota archaeon]|jgi:hypothetical protein